jgi:phosphatidylethanolamine/phosphatidyl-N-methylethanolamine N-methyltransferase
MSSPPKNRLAHDPRVQFFRGFLQHPKEVGSIIPSSRFLEKRIVRAAGIRKARTLVELGPGTGGTTRALLRAMDPQATLVAIEINPRFVRLLETTLDDPRLHVVHGSAADVSDALASLGLPAPDVILSGIPFSTMPPDLAASIVQSAHDALSPTGRFVAYQVRDRVEILGNRVFGPASVQMELLNVPPMRVYRWDKPTTQPSAQAT